MLLRESCIVVVLLGLCLGGCTDVPPGQDHNALVRSYDRTLTKDEKRTVIKELRQDKTKQQQASQDESGAKATPAKKQE
jgi:hypothetical protein